MITVADAVMSLRPHTEWTMSGDDVEGIIWHTEGVEPLSAKEVQAEIKRLEKEAAQREKAAAEARAAAIEHAKSLGFTDAMIAVMYPNLSVAGDVTE